MSFLKLESLCVPWKKIQGGFGMTRGRVNHDRFFILGCNIPLKGKLAHTKENPTPTDTLLSNTEAEASSGIDLWNGGISCGYVWGNIFCQYLLWPTDPKPKTVSPQNDSHLYMQQHTKIAQRSADCIVRCPTAYWLLFLSSCLREMSSLSINTSLQN